MPEVALQEYLDGLYRYCDDGLLELRSLPSGEQAWIPREEWPGIQERLATREHLYYGVGLRGTRRGTKDAVASIPAVWVDVDAKDFGGDLRAAWDSLWEHRPMGRHWTYVVQSGGGFHAYCRLKEPAGPEDFPRLEAINRGLAKSVGGDMNATDAARILRLPGSMNWKYSPPRLVKVRYAGENEWNLSDLEMYEERGIAVPVPTAEDRIERFETLFRRCRFLEHCRKDAATLPEPQWYAAISNLVRFPGCVSLIHEISRPYPGYSRAETDAKILQALEASGPTGCDAIRRHFDCGRRCGVRSPAGLLRVTPVPEDTAPPFKERDERIRAMVEAAVPDHGWIREYIDYAEKQTDAPRIFQLFAALWCLSVTVERKVAIPYFGVRPLYPNLWVVLIAPSSTYHKSTVVDIAADMASNTGAYLLPQEFSQEQLIGELSSHPRGSFLWSEFGQPLAAFERDYMSGVKDLLANLYDCPEFYERSLRAGVLRVEQPYLSALAATNIDWMVDKKRISNDLRGGFLARWLYVPHTSKSFTLEEPNPVDWGWRAELARTLRQIREREPVSLSLERISAQRASLKAEIERELNNSPYLVELSALYSRYQAVALKLAALYDVSFGRWGGEISEEAMSLAEGAVRVLRDSVSNLVAAVPRHKDDALTAEIMTKISLLHQQGNPWVSLRDVYRYTGRPKEVCEKCLRELTEMGRLSEREEKRTRVWQIRLDA